MKTFIEFISEKYYEPDEPLPSGKTPYGKATSSYYRQRGEFKRGPRTSDQGFRMVMQGSRRSNEVSRGADNPNFDPKPDKSGQYDIDTDSDYKMTVRDTKNDLEMRVRQKDQIAPGRKPIYDIEWYNMTGKNKHTPGEARGVTRKVADMWKNQVAPRIPSNSVITNFPIQNDTSKRNTRAKFYSKVAGFGEPGVMGRQYAAVGRNPSSKQAAKGAQRITPLSGNLDPQWRTRGEMDALKIDREHKWTSRADEPKYFQGPRKIAPAKPSRPLQNQAVRALKSTAPIKSPLIPKTPKLTPQIATSIKPPKMPSIKIRAGGRAALAAGLVSAGIGALSALSNKKK